MTEKNDRKKSTPPPQSVLNRLNFVSWVVFVKKNLKKINFVCLFWIFWFFCRFLTEFSVVLCHRISKNDRISRRLIVFNFKKRQNPKSFFNGLKKNDRNSEHYGGRTTLRLASFIVAFSIPSWNCSSNSNWFRDFVCASVIDF